MKQGIDREEVQSLGTEEVSRLSRIGDPEDWHIFTEDERYVIWEEFFGKRYSLGHIAQNFSVRKEKIVTAIEQEAVHRCKLE